MFPLPSDVMNHDSWFTIHNDRNLTNWIEIVLTELETETTNLFLRKAALSSGIVPAPQKNVIALPQPLPNKEAERSALKQSYSLRFGNVEEEDFEMKQESTAEPVELKGASAGSSTAGPQQPEPGAMPSGDSGPTLVVVFKVCHKNPSLMKRALSAVDDLQSGDVAVKMYAVLSHGDSFISIRRMNDATVVLLRFLHTMQQHQLDQVVESLRVWRRAQHEMVNMMQDTMSQEALDLLSDMSTARCFIGTGRSYEHPVLEDELGPMQKLEELGLACQIPDEHVQEGAAQTRWCLTAKAASVLEAGVSHVVTCKGRCDIISYDERLGD